MSDCADCAANGRKGYCAPGRCYCAHKTCHAFASWTELPELSDAPAPHPNAKRHRDAWTSREEDSWIDKL